MANGKIMETIVQIAGEISPTLGKSIGAVEKRLEGVNVKALAAGAAIGSMAIGTIGAVFKAGKALAKLGDEYNSAVNDISAATGLVGAELESMGDVVKEVYGSNFGESMEDAAAGIAAVYQATGLTEDALANTTKAAYALSDTFGFEVAESARAAKAMMTNFGVSGEEAMNLIANGAQNGLDFSGELIDSISEYSVQFSKLGFSADDMFNIFQQGADSGAWNLDKVGDAVKEFSIRSIDGSKTTTHAFEALGYNADEMMATFAKGGDGASEAFQKVLKDLMNMDDQVQRDAVGVELFGTQWEDLGLEAMKAMSEMDDKAYATRDAIAQINEVQFDNLGDAFESIKRQGEVMLLPLASTIAKTFTAIAPQIASLFEKLGPIIEQVTTDAMPFLTEFLGGILDILPTLTPLLVQLADAVLPMLSKLVSELLPPILDMVSAILPPLIEIINAVLPVLIELFTLILPMLTQIVSAILPVILEIISALLPALMPIVEVLLQLLESIIMPLMEPIMILVEALLPVIAPILEVIHSVLSPIAPVLEIIGEVLGVIVGAIAKVVGWIADGLGWLVDLIFGDSEGASEVAAYATGGFTNGVSIAGEDPRYPTEAVISFNPAYRSQNLSYWAQAGRMLGADASDYSLGTSSSSTSIDLGGITFAPNIVIKGNADKESIMDAIEEEYPEFMDMLEEFFARKAVTAYA